MPHKRHNQPKCLRFVGCKKQKKKNEKEKKNENKTTQGFFLKFRSSYTVEPRALLWSFFFPLFHEPLKLTFERYIFGSFSITRRF